MTAIIIRSDKLAAGRDEGHVPAQPYAGGTAQIIPTRVVGKSHPHGTAGVRELATVRMSALGAGERIVVHIRCSKHLNSPAYPFQSAASFLSRGVIPAGSSPDRRFAGARCVLARPRLFEFVLAITAARHLFLSPRCAIQACKQSFRGISKAFHQFSLLLSDIQENDRRKRQGVVRA
jgi:hypothetical protein